MFGSKGSNACPEGSTRIVNWTVCAIAAEDSGKYFSGNYSTSSLPTGCVAQNDYYVYFNPASPGAAEANMQPLCIPGAPPRFCTAIVSHPVDIPVGVLVRYHASNQSCPQGALSEALKQTLLQLAQSKSDECAACM